MSLGLLWYNKQWLNSVLLFSMWKFWTLILKYKCPIKCVFLPFYSFICDFLKFPSAKSSKLFTAYRIQRDRNLKHRKSRGCKGSFSIFSIICLSPLQKNWSYRFPWEKSSDWSEMCITNPPNFTEIRGRKRKKFTVSFAFCAYADVIKYPKSADVFLRAHVDY